MDKAQNETFRQTLTTATTQVGVPLSPEQLDACARYVDLLLATNQHVNLTRIVEPAEVAVKHFADSLTLFRALPDLPENATLADVGTGAGFPGLVVKIARPDLRVTLLDATAKRLTFLRDVAEALDLRGVSLVHARAEDAGRDPKYRDRFDLVTARAVAALPTLLEWCGPLVRVGGQFVAMKGANITEERIGENHAAALLGLVPTSDVALALPTVPGENEPAQRRLLVYEKRKPTPTPYPRRPSEIKAKPLG